MACILDLKHKLYGLLAVITVIYFNGLTNNVTALNIGECRKVLGMQSGDILDSALSASSSHNMANVGPRSSRIRTEIEGGAWCPKDSIGEEMQEWLQVEFEDMMVITLVETQGRFGQGQGQEFVEQYLLQYQREDGGPWFRYRSRRNQEIIQGNQNTYMSELREVDPPIMTRRIRFIPYSSNPKTVCMRVELYGCPWTDGLVSYSMRQGERRGTEIDLYDFTYDGTIHNTQLTGGLGQLTDGIEGEDNFRVLNQQGRGVKGYEWVGWRNETNGVSQPVEIIFKFDTVRNFSALRIHCNNYFTKEVRVFSNATVQFSVGGDYYLSEPLHYVFMRDGLIQLARYVIIRLDNHIGQYVKLQMAFDSRWILISEVQFESEKVTGPVPIEDPPTTTTASAPVVAIKPTEGIKRVLPEPKGSKNNNRQLKPANNKNNKNGNKNNQSSKPMQSVDNQSGGVIQSSNDTTTQPGTVVDTYKKLNEGKIGMIIGVLTALILLLIAVIVVIVVRHRRHKMTNNHRAMMKIVAAHHQNVSGDFSTIHNHPPPPPPGVVYNYTALDNSDFHKSAPADDQYGGDVYVAPPHVNGRGSGFVPLPQTPGSIDTVSREYAVPDLTRSSYTGPNYPRSLPVSPLTSPRDGPYLTTTLPHVLAAPMQCTTNISPDLSNMQSVSGGNVYTLLDADQPWTENHSVLEIPKEALTFVEKLGHGQFGEVHLCQAHGLNDIIPDQGQDYNRSSLTPIMVAVKTLTHNANENARRDFHKEVQIMSRLQDPNIVRVLGVCSQNNGQGNGGPLCVVVEYMPYGDLHQYLRRHVSETATVGRRNHQEVLSYGALIYVATQIASGMKYLESLNMVHRDLATRNCLVGTSYTIKIADFGMSRNLYSNDYYRVEGKAVLPIRWMAWESVILGKFSCKSDMWSFGVTLWEILTFAREQPLDSLSDEAVVDNCTHYYRQDGLELQPAQPSSCPREIYDLMCSCWSRQDSGRPSFREIHMFLANKNQGFDPTEDKYGLNLAVGRQATLPLNGTSSRPL